MVKLFRSDREVTSNPCLSVCFIRPEILGIFSYFRHIRIISYVGLESYFLAINLDATSLYNVFNNLIYVFRCKYITILNE